MEELIASPDETCRPECNGATVVEKETDGIALNRLDVNNNVEIGEPSYEHAALDLGGAREGSTVDFDHYFAPRGPTPGVPRGSETAREGTGAQGRSEAKRTSSCLARRMRQRGA